jgi:ubiquinone/menaquinone biosynthesis C-methylase UbiE
MKTIRYFPLFLLILFCLSYSQRSNHDNHSAQVNIDPERERFYWQMPQRVIEEIGIEEGMVVADVGSGDGYFTLRIGKKVGSAGKVYASDIDQHALQKLEQKVSRQGLGNVEIIVGREDDPLLPAGKIDLVLLVNVIHLIDDMKAFLANITPSLKKKGILIIVQWDAEKMDWELQDWDESNRELFTMRTTLGKIYDSNYEVVKIKTFLPMQNIYFCEPREMKE